MRQSRHLGIHNQNDNIAKLACQIAVAFFSDNYNIGYNQANRNSFKTEFFNQFNNTIPDLNSIINFNGEFSTSTATDCSAFVDFVYYLAHRILHYPYHNIGNGFYRTFNFHQAVDTDNFKYVNMEKAQPETEEEYNNILNNLQPGDIIIRHIFLTQEQIQKYEEQGINLESLGRKVGDNILQGHAILYIGKDLMNKIFAKYSWNDYINKGYNIIECGGPSSSSNIANIAGGLHICKWSPNIWSGQIWKTENTDDGIHNNPGIYVLRKEKPKRNSSGANITFQENEIILELTQTNYPLDDGTSNHIFNIFEEALEDLKNNAIVSNNIKYDYPKDTDEDLLSYIKLKDNTKIYLDGTENKTVDKYFFINVNTQEKTFTITKLDMNIEEFKIYIIFSYTLPFSTTFNMPLYNETFPSLIYYPESGVIGANNEQISIKDYDNLISLETGGSWYKLEKSTIIPDGPPIGTIKIQDNEGNWSTTKYQSCFGFPLKLNTQKKRSAVITSLTLSVAQNGGQFFENSDYHQDINNKVDTNITSKIYNYDEDSAYKIYYGLYDSSKEKINVNLIGNFNWEYGTTENYKQELFKIDNITQNIITNTQAYIFVTNSFIYNLNDAQGSARMGVKNFHIRSNTITYTIEGKLGAEKSDEESNG